MSQTPSVPQSVLARRLGISQAAVSMALAGNPRISKSTRQRVLELAKALGHRPDPGLRTLARYRKKVRPASFQATLGWVHTMTSEEAWKNSAVYGQFYTAAEQRADQLGYKLENFWLNPEEFSDHRASRILASRGISGLLLLPHLVPHHSSFLDWDRFSAIRILDYTLQNPPLHCVATDHHASTQMALEEVLSRGYRRPALVTTQAFEERLMQQPTAAFLGLQHARNARWPGILYGEKTTAQSFMKWYREERPDVLLMTYAVESFPKVVRLVRASGLSVPEDIGLCMLCLPDHAFQRGETPDLDFSGISGVDEHWTELATRSVELLVEMLERFETGIPEMPMRHLMKGVWTEGRTLRPAKPGRGQPALERFSRAR